MIQLCVIIGYLVLLLMLGLSANRFFRGTATDYMLASHSIGPVLLLMSLFGTTMTAFALVGSTGQAYRAGIGVYGELASASGIIHSLCFFVIGLPLWALGRRHGYTTQIQFFRDRLQSDFLGLLLFPILVLLVISYLLVGIVGGGAVVESITADAFKFGESGWFASSGYGVPSWIASAVICGVVLLYVFFGGMRGTAWANAFQTAVFMVLGLVTFVTVANALGGSNAFLENLKIATQSAEQSHLSMEKMPKAVFFSFLFIPLSVAMFPHVFQHWLTARSAESFKLPIIMHPVFILIVWAPCVLLGVWASGENSGVPAALAGMGPEKFNKVLPTLVKLHAGDVLGGLLSAGILAAIMSSLDSQFLCLGTVFTEDIVRHYGGRERYSDTQVVRLARYFVVGVVVLTYLLSLLLPGSVFTLGLWSFSGFTGLVPLVFAAIYWRRLTAAGAIASVATTVGCWTVLFIRAGGKPYTFPEQPLSIVGLVTIPKMLPVVTIFAASGLVLVVVSLLTRRPEQETLDKFFSS